MRSTKRLTFRSKHLQTTIVDASRRHTLRSLVDTLTGALLCAWLAPTAALAGQTWHYSPELLILLIPAVGAVARFWGFAGAMLGPASALAVFRVGLFTPIGRLDVASADARASLMWLMLGASVAAYVLARPRRMHTEIRHGGVSCWSPTESVHSAGATH